MKTILSVDSALGVLKRIVKIGKAKELLEKIRGIKYSQETKIKISKIIRGK